MDNYISIVGLEAGSFAWKFKGAGYNPIPGFLVENSWMSMSNWTHHSSCILLSCYYVVMFLLLCFLYLIGLLGHFFHPYAFVLEITHCFSIRLFIVLFSVEVFLSIIYAIYKMNAGLPVTLVVIVFVHIVLTP